MNALSKQCLWGKISESRPFSSISKISLAIWICGSSLLATEAYAQKKPLDHDVYDDWQSIGTRQISRDGKWTAYHVNPQEGDKWLHIQSTSKQHPIEKIHRGEKLAITADSEHVVFTIKPFYKDIKADRVQKKKKSKKKSELAKDSLGIYNLSKKTIIKFPEIHSFKLPKENGNYLAYLQEVEIEADTIKKTKKENFKRLILRDLKAQREISFDHVDQYAFSENGSYLVYNIKSTDKKKEEEDKESEENSEENIENKSSEEETENKKEGVYLIDTKTFTEIAVTDKEGIYSNLVFNENSNLLTFIATHDEKKEEVKDYMIYLYDIESHSLQDLDNHISGMPENWVFSENYSPKFSKNSNKLYVGIAPKKEPKDTTLIEEDYAVLDIWHYKEDYLQTQQLANLKRDLKRTYLSVVALDNTSKLIPLEDEKMNYTRLVHKGDADFVLAASDYGNRIARQWDLNGEMTYYLVSTKTGEKKEVLKNLIGRVTMSPEGKNLVFYDSKSQDWFVYDVASERIQHLNKGLDISFANERHDQPSDASAYTLIGWTEGDKSVLINDRYDIWEFFLDSDKTPKNITQSYGRENKINFSYIKLDKEATHINTKQPLLLAAFQEDNKESGFYTLDVQKNKSPKKLLMEPKSGHRTLVKAKDADNYLFVQESFVLPPSLVHTKNLKTTNLLHRTNPQQADYNWATSELIYYTAQNGKPAVGMLIKPEDFDETKQYPVISYFYERRSDALHQYEAPAPTPSRLNITYFASNGYLIFVPDIEYTEGYPGRSAEEYVDAGIDYLKTFDFVNKDKIGIQGQSWGGYQVAHLITRSDRYAAAWAGAPVVNMTSAYGGIRWTTGMNRQFQYEKTQSRIGKNLWDGLDLYLENSPLFYMENVTTPVAIMHNDRDGAVPWYQGIEMFTALRRLEKPVWLLNYNEDEHNLMKRQNRKDIQIREQQFFDHYLKDAPAPVWMVKGIPAVKKGKTWGFELTDEKP